MMPQITRSLAVLVWTVLGALALPSLGATPAEFVSKNGPTLVDPIPDQTLYLGASSSQTADRELSASYFVYNLQYSFDVNQEATFSSYVYNDDAASVWIVQNQLIVRAENLGTTQVAITASNANGSTIDWFIIQVEEEIPSTRIPSNHQNYQITPRGYYFASAERQLDIKLPSLAEEPITYSVVPQLAEGLRFVPTELRLSGQLYEETTQRTYLLIGITPNQSIHLHEFELNLVPNTSQVAEILRIGDTVVAQLPEAIGVHSGGPQQWSQTTNQSESTFLGSYFQAQYSRPSSEGFSTIEPVDVSLEGWTSSLHSRTRQDSREPFESTNRLSELQVWNRSTYTNSSSSQMSRALIGIEYEPSQSFQSRLGVGLEFGRSSRSSGNPIAGVLPYWRWKGESGAQVWGLIGIESAQLATGDNSVVTALGWRQPIGGTGVVKVASIGDVGVSIPLAESSAESTIKTAIANSSRSIRAGVEVAYTGSTRLEPFIGVSGRLNQMLEARNSGLETSGGVRLTDIQGMTLEAEGRALSLHQSEDLSWGVSIAAHLDPGLRGEGFAISLSPSYGITNQVASPNINWVGTTHSNEWALDQSWSMSGALSYGMPLLQNATLTPFGQISISTLNQTRMGFRVELDPKLSRGLDLEVASVRYGRDEEQTLNQGIDIQLRLVF